MTTLNDFAYTVLDNSVADVTLPSYSVGDLLVLFFTGKLDVVFSAGFPADWTKGFANDGHAYAYIRVADGSEGSVFPASEYNPTSVTSIGAWCATSWTPPSGYLLHDWSNMVVADMPFGYVSGDPVTVSGTDGFAPASLVDHLLFGWLFEILSLTTAGAFDTATGSPSPTVEDTLTTATLNSPANPQKFVTALAADLSDRAGDSGAWDFEFDWTFTGSSPSVLLLALPVLPVLPSTGGGGGGGGGAGGLIRRQPDGYWGILAG